MQKELTEVQKAYLLLAQTLDNCVKKGALERKDVLNYDMALQVLDPVIFPQSEEGLKKVEEQENK